MVYDWVYHMARNQDVDATKDGELYQSTIYGKWLIC
jgi:hypothetical protein